MRFLGVDAPEVTAPLPGTQAPLVALDDPRWEQALAAAFAPGAQPLGPAADPALVAHLEARAVVGEAVNHARLAAAARIALVDTASKDMAALGVDARVSRFFLAFAATSWTATDASWSYVKLDQPHAPAEQRLGSYNQRLSGGGLGQPVLHLAQHQPVAGGARDRRRGARARHRHAGRGGRPGPGRPRGRR